MVRNANEAYKRLVEIHSTKDIDIIAGIFIKDTDWEDYFSIAEDSYQYSTDMSESFRKWANSRIKKYESEGLESRDNIIIVIIPEEERKGIK